MKKKSNNKNTTNYIITLVALLVGFAVGYFAHSFMQTEPTPTQEVGQAEKIEQAKNEISELYKDKAVGACWRVNDGAKLAANNYELNYRNIQINGTANRAIITDCAGGSTLLAKNKSGQWVATNVNITTFNRVNPAWQKECDIQDITVADTEIRPENASIDDANLAECKQLKRQ